MLYSAVGRLKYMLVQGYFSNYAGNLDISALRVLDLGNIPADLCLQCAVFKTPVTGRIENAVFEYKPVHIAQ